MCGLAGVGGTNQRRHCMVIGSRRARVDTPGRRLAAIDKSVGKFLPLPPKSNRSEWHKHTNSFVSNLNFKYTQDSPYENTISRF